MQTEIARLHQIQIEALYEQTSFDNLSFKDDPNMWLVLQIYRLILTSKKPEYAEQIFSRYPEELAAFRNINPKFFLDFTPEIIKIENAEATISTRSFDSFFQDNTFDWIYTNAFFIIISIIGVGLAFLAFWKKAKPIKKWFSKIF